MNNLASFTLSILLAYTVYAQPPFLSSPYYYHNGDILPMEPNVPVLYQNSDQYVLHRDALASLLLRELKENSKRWAETNAVIGTVKKEMTNEILNLKNELAQLKKLTEDKVGAENLKTNGTNTQTGILTTQFEPFTIDYSSNKEIPTARFCNCLLIQQRINSLGKDLADTNVNLKTITDDIKVSLGTTNNNLKTITDGIQTNLDTTNGELKKMISDIKSSLGTTNVNLKTITNEIKLSLSTTNNNLKKITDGIKINLDTTNAKFKTITDNIKVSLGTTNTQLKTITDGIKTNIDTTNSNLKTITDGIKTSLDTTNTDLDTLTTQFKVSISPTTIDKEPTSCADLKQLGYQKSGIFSVKVNQRVNSVYCDFTKTDATGLQTLIGTVDVKSTSVSFHAQLSAPYDTLDTPVAFDLLRTNVGNAMSTSTGIFTAPTTGTYFFAYSGVSFERRGAKVELQMKTEPENWIGMGVSYSTGDGNYQTFALQSTLQLLKDDQIRLLLVEGKIHDSLDHFTNYVGFLLEEELV